MRIHVEGTRAEIGALIFHLRTRYHLTDLAPMRKVTGTTDRYSRHLTFTRKDTRP